MSHGRGCPCGREPYEYRDCEKSDCDKRKPVMKANDKQVGGNHYKRANTQHWDWIARCQIGYFEGCSTKYLARWPFKFEDPAKKVEDLGKSIHFVEKLIEEIEYGLYKNHAEYDSVKFEAFCDDNELDSDQRSLCYRISHWNSIDDLRIALLDLKVYVGAQRDKLAGSQDVPEAVGPAVATNTQNNSPKTSLDPRRTSGRVPRSICQVCNGTGKVFMERNAHESAGTVPCSACTPDGEATKDYVNQD